MKNPAFYPKTVELIIDWQQVESIADSDLQQFFCYARECLAGIFHARMKTPKRLLTKIQQSAICFLRGQYHFGYRNSCLLR